MYTFCLQNMIRKLCPELNVLFNSTQEVKSLYKPFHLLTEPVYYNCVSGMLLLDRAMGARAISVLPVTQLHCGVIISVK